MQWARMSKVYSYTRFSTPEQAAGDSYRRQTEAARKWAEARGLLLDEKLSFADEGVSAYRGSNRKDDKGLGAFLFACEQGLVERGSFLLVESLDRLSRMDPYFAQRQLGDIVVGHGVTVVTLNDNQEYSEDRLRSDPMALIVSLMVSWRAHEESKTKGRRVAAAWAEKRERVRRGEDKLLTRRAPAWLEWSGDSWQPIPAHADTVRRIFRMAREGVGEHATAKLLNEEGVPVMGRGKAWHRSTVSKLLRNPAVIGQLVPGHIEFDANGKKMRVTEEPIVGAYPAIISDEDWLAVRALKDGSTHAPRGRGASRPLQNVFAGLAQCPECGAAMTRVFKGRKGGKPKLVCTMAKAGKAKHYRSVTLDYVENALFDKWQGLLADVPSADGDELLDRAVQDLEGSIEAKQDHLAELLAELERGASQTLTKATRRIEEELRTLKEALGDLQERRELSDGGMIAMRLDALGQAMEPEDDTERTREKVNAALRSLFDGVVVDYRQGRLLFQWKQGGESSLMFAWPEGG